MPVLHALLQFVAAVEDIQQLPTGNYITVSFIDEDDVSAIMPLASTCTLMLYLPVVHADYGDFKTAFVNALEYGVLGFGMV